MNRPFVVRSHMKSKIQEKRSRILSGTTTSRKEIITLLTFWKYIYSILIYHLSSFRIENFRAERQPETDPVEEPWNTADV